MNGYLQKERMLKMLIDSPAAEINSLSEEQEQRRFRITSFVQAVAMLSQPIGIKALKIAAVRLSITPHGLITLLSAQNLASSTENECQFLNYHYTLELRKQSERKYFLERIHQIRNDSALPFHNERLLLKKARQVRAHVFYRKRCNELVYKRYLLSVLISNILVEN